MAKMKLNVSCRFVIFTISPTSILLYRFHDGLFRKTLYRLTPPDLFSQCNCLNFTRSSFETEYFSLKVHFFFSLQKARIFLNFF